MVGTAVRTLHFAVRFLLVFVGLWLFLAALPQISETPAFAGDKQCTVQANSCGCVACGCGDFGRPSCPPGQVLYDDYCLPECPAGHVRYPGIPGLCMPPCHHGCPEGYDQVPLPQCPPGFHRDLRDPDYCVADRDRQRHRDNCPYGMAYSSETGQCEVDCPQGTYLAENGLCESYYRRECPQNYTRDPETGKCLPPGIWPPGYRWVCLPTCPPGTYRDIRQPTRCIPPPQVCPEGYQNIDGRCLPLCEPGTERDRYGYCVPPRCPDGSYANLRGQCSEPECPQGSEKYRGQCVPVCDEGWTRDDNGRCLPPDDGCPPATELINGQCMPDCKAGLERDENGRCVPPRPDCPEGLRLNEATNQCERIPPNTPKCRQGMTYSSVAKKCVPIRPPEVKCKKGEFKDKNGRCRPIPVEEQECKEGFRPDGQGGCIRIQTLVPRGCPEGTYLDKRRKRCLPIPEETDQGEQDPDEPPLQRLNPGIKLDPDAIEQLIPRRKVNPAINQQSDCPDGMFRDKNGRCVDE